MSQIGELMLNRTKLLTQIKLEQTKINDMVWKLSAKRHEVELMVLAHNTLDRKIFEQTVGVHKVSIKTCKCPKTDYVKTFDQMEPDEAARTLKMLKDKLAERQKNDK